MSAKEWWCMRCADYTTETPEDHKKRHHMPAPAPDWRNATCGACGYRLEEVDLIELHSKKCAVSAFEPACPDFTPHGRGVNS